MRVHIKHTNVKHKVNDNYSLLLLIAIMNDGWLDNVKDIKGPFNSLAYWQLAYIIHNKRKLTFWRKLKHENTH